MLLSRLHVVFGSFLASKVSVFRPNSNQGTGRVHMCSFCDVDFAVVAYASADSEDFGVARPLQLCCLF